MRVVVIFSILNARSPISNESPVSAKPADFREYNPKAYGIPRFPYVESEILVDS